MLFDIVTVTYPGEADAFRMHAHSISKWLNSTRDLGRVWLVVNGSRNDPSAQAIFEEAPILYGQHQGRLTVLYSDDVLGFGVNCAGYISQQLIKLQISDIIESSYYIVLDTKNVLIGDVSTEYFFSGNKPKMKFEIYSGTFQSYILEEYYNILEFSVDRRIYRMPSMMTPFCFPTDEVRKSVKYVEGILGISLNQCFLKLFFDKNLFSEFLLFSASLVMMERNFLDIYYEVERLSLTLWGGDSVGLQSLELALCAVLESNTRIIGIHKERWRTMQVDELSYLRKFFVDSCHLNFGCENFPFPKPN